jgi:hypothetical protein
MKLNNINGTSDLSCKCYSWFEHWKRFSGQTVEYCPVESCLTKNDLVGAHVQKDSYLDTDWYIAPLCKKHNAETGKSLNVPDWLKLASANVSKTCGY